MILATQKNNLAHAQAAITEAITGPALSSAAKPTNLVLLNFKKDLRSDNKAPIVYPILISVLAHILIVFAFFAYSSWRSSNSKELQQIHMITFEQVASGNGQSAANLVSSQSAQPEVAKEEVSLSPKVLETELPKEAIPLKPKPVEQKIVKKNTKEQIQKEIIPISNNLPVTNQATDNLATGTASGSDGSQQNAGQFGEAASGGSYDSLVLSQLVAAKRYPERARRRGLEGEIVLAFAINRDGSVSNSQLSKSSESEILNDAAMAMLERAAPFPPPPSNYLPGKIIEYKVPVKFVLQ
jgi:protein TonB